VIYEISFNNTKEKLKLPVNPSELKISNGGASFTDINVIKGGERTIIGNRNLRTVAFSSFFPKRYDSSFCNYKNIPRPWRAIKTIEKWRNSGKPVKLLITGTNVNMYCTIRKFEYQEKGGEPGDIYFDLEFKEFKFIKIRQVKNKKTDGTSSRPDTQEQPRTYVVVSGDCLWNIAKRFYGTGAQYPVIFNANSPPIQNPNLIYPGQVLIIP